MRLFCFPHAGGGASVFHSWHSTLAPTIQVCPILLPGRETRLSDPPYASFDSLLEALTHQLQPWIDVPFAAFGHSMGALLAFELVRKLQEDGKPMPAWLFLSGRRAPDAPDKAPLLTPLPDGEFLEELTRRYQGMSQEFLQEPELMAVVLPILRADLAVVESYSYRESRELECPLTVFAGIEDSTVTYEQLLGWRRQTKARFTAQLFPGAHFYPQASMLETISRNLSEISSERFAK